MLKEKDWWSRFRQCLRTI